MSNNKVNLNKLREEIDNRKKGKNVVSSKLGENVMEQAPRYSFLHGLVESLKTGRETPSTALVKSVENKVSEKNGETSRFNVDNNKVLNENNNNRRIPPVQTNDNIDLSQDRDELLFTELEKKRQKTLAESIEDYYPKQNTQNRNHQTQQKYNTPTNINEGVLNENVQRMVNNYLIENFGTVLDEAINSTIIEMYAIERIKTVLHENKDLIKTVVIETIKEIQAKNKLKKQ